MNSQLIEILFNKNLFQNLNYELMIIHLKVDWSTVTPYCVFFSQDSEEENEEEEEEAVENNASVPASTTSPTHATPSEPTPTPPHAAEPQPTTSKSEIEGACALHDEKG